MAQINWQDRKDSTGRPYCHGEGPFTGIANHWAIYREFEFSELQSRWIVRFEVYCQKELGGSGCEPSEGLPVDSMGSLEAAKLYCQECHDEAISGCDTGW